MKSTLKNVLSDDLELEVPDIDDAEPEIDAANCVECGDQPKELLCVQCDESFCSVCFEYLHRTGKRRQHRTKAETKESDVAQETATEAAQEVGQEAAQEAGQDAAQDSQESTQLDEDLSDVSDMSDVSDVTEVDASFIPMRLTMEERKLFRLLVAALEVSEYTDKVDVYLFASKAKRIVRELKEICTVLTGLVVANGMDVGKLLVEDGDFAQHAEWFQTVFEIGRRYKIMNPERMRSSYGKLVYMIMDSRLPEVRQVMDFDLYKPVLTVESYLADHNMSGVLRDPRLELATASIDATGKSRATVKNEIRLKERAIEQLVRVYGEDVRQALYSLGDFNVYLAANKVPVQMMRAKLLGNYDPQNHQGDPQYSLGISSGRHGARLTHDHARQFQYVLQSLTLWEEIMHEMYRLWKLADDDLLAAGVRYRLEDTGQGLQRVKASPQVGRRMHTIISRAQQRTGRWVGSSVVHLGDRAVPNSLFFLDKYLQVPRILTPVNNTLKLVPEVLDSDKYAMQWAVSQYGSVDALELAILTDFFRYAFDGSGADNFYDAGSCIDGRLTSAWNWANQLPKKPYHKFFLVTGFIGFDGEEGF